MILPLALILCFMVGCQDREAMAEIEALKTQAEIEEQNKTTFRNMIEETDRGNYEAWDEVCSPDYVFHFSGMSMKLEEHKPANRAMLVAFPDLKHKIINMVAKGDRVVMRVNLTGTHEGEYMGIPPQITKLITPLCLKQGFRRVK